MPELKLEQKLSLKQILTPQLIQSLQLLQIPKLELATELRAELEQNPMLDIIEEDLGETAEIETESDVDRDLDEWDRIAEGLALSGSQLPENDPDNEEIDPYFATKSEKSLDEHLLEQLALTTNDARIYRIGEFIIGNLDSKGFLPTTDEDLLNDAVKNNILEPPPVISEISETVKIIQNFSPTGIASRDLRDCFLAQLADKGETGKLPWMIVAEHFEDLKNKNIPQLADILGVDAEAIENAMEILGALSFSPAADYSTDTSGAIDPDLIVEKVNGRWIVRYNNIGIPELRISPEYRNLLKNRRSLDKDAKQFLSKKLSSAQWWIQALDQRRDTMIRTMRAILHHQFAFFENGPNNLSPLKMEEIAEEVGVHPATISRVVRDKYAQTPFGIYALRHFFGGGLATESGEDIATSNVKRRLKTIIESEEPSKPLADQKITEMLNLEGIYIARRTVAKYREELGVATARMRKRRKK